MFILSFDFSGSSTNWNTSSPSVINRGFDERNIMSVTLEQLAQSYATIQQQQATIQKHEQTIQSLQTQLTAHQETLARVSAKWNALEDALRSAVTPPASHTIPAVPAVK